jgi:hypothetical protein
MVERVEFERDWERQILALVAPAMAAGAERVAEHQRRHIPVSRDGSYGRLRGYARSRIRVERGTDAVGPHWDIGSDATTPDGTSYPRILDLGSRPHTITSHGDYPLRNKKRGDVFGRSVQHPGTKPTAWCRGSLEVLRGQDL